MMGKVQDFLPILHRLPSIHHISHHQVLVLLIRLLTVGSGLKEPVVPPCGTAADLIGYGGYGRDLIQNTHDDPHVYVKDKDLKSCEKLVHFNHTDWRDFYFVDEESVKAISSQETYEVAKDKGVCCVRGVSSDPTLRCPPERKAPHWQWMKNACRPSCGAAAHYSGYGYGPDDKPNTKDDTFYACLRSPPLVRKWYGMATVIGKAFPLWTGNWKFQAMNLGMLHKLEGFVVPEELLMKIHPTRLMQNVH